MVICRDISISITPSDQQPKWQHLSPAPIPEDSPNSGQKEIFFVSSIQPPLKKKLRLASTNLIPHQILVKRPTQKLKMNIETSFVNTKLRPKIQVVTYNKHAREKNLHAHEHAFFFIRALLISRMIFYFYHRMHFYFYNVRRRTYLINIRHPNIMHWDMLAPWISGKWYLHIEYVTDAFR